MARFDARARPPAGGWSDTARISGGRGSTPGTRNRECFALPALYDLQVFFGGVDLPQEVVNAHRDGRLVFFVGAGASVPEPSSLPLFGRLAQDIAAIVGRSFDPRRRDIDVMLGEIDDDEDVDVHSLIRDAIDLPGTTPNELHHAIGLLAACSGHPRIVTTNYDRHLSTVLDELGIADRFYAPALPVGDDFEGVVYLHGSVSRAPRWMVATDRDFGAAYLRDAWATRFLERLFQTHTVLFVGYSHEDVVMSYLAKGLRGSGARFALTHAPQREHWARLGITPIAYDPQDEHLQLSTCLGSWAQWSRSGLLNHREQIVRIAGAAPALTDDEDSYIRQALCDPDWIHFLLDTASGELWLEWVSATDSFEALLSGDPVVPETAWPLARWLAQEWLSSEDACRIGWASLGQRQTLPHILSSALLWQMQQQEYVPLWQEPWIVRLLQQPDSVAGQAWIVAELAAKCSRDCAMTVFETLATPRVEARAPWSAATRSEVTLAAEEYLLRQIWESSILPSLSDTLEDVLDLLEHAFNRASRLARATGSANAHFDPWSYGRSAIAQHAQDARADAEDVLIDALRECIMLAMASRPDQLARFERWLRPTAPHVLRRMAIHAQTIRNDRDAASKARLLLDYDLLFDVACHHEVFELLEATGSELPEPLVAELIESSRRHGAEGEGSGYDEFLLSDWLHRHTAHEIARQYRDEVSGAHPEWQVRDHPDFLGWHESGVIEPVDLIPADEMHAAIAEGAANALAALTALVEDDVLSPRSRSSALQTLRTVVKAYPDDGFLLLSSAPNDNDLEQAVLDGWGSVSLTDAQATAICGVLSAKATVQNARSIAQLLKSGSTTDAGYPWHQLTQARDLARQVWWAAAESSAPYVTGNDPLTDSINDVGGFVAEFWTQAVSHDWRESKQWEGLTPSLREALEEILESEGRASTLARVFLASQLHFWHGADRPWCLSNVLPLLAWDEPDRARVMWSGFLSWGRWTNQLLEDGLLNYYLDSAANKLTMERGEHRLALHLASVALNAAVDPGWITRLATVADADTRARWAEFIGRDLDELDPARRESIWVSWMGEYWRARASGRPRRIATAEGTAMTSWAMPMDQYRREALGLAARSNGYLDQSAHVLDGFTAERVADAPNESAMLFVVLLRAAKRPLYNHRRVREVFDMFNGTTVDLEPLREAALSAECRDAANW